MRRRLRPVCLPRPRLRRQNQRRRRVFTVLSGEGRSARQSAGLERRSQSAAAMMSAKRFCASSASWSGSRRTRRKGPPSASGCRPQKLVRALDHIALCENIEPLLHAVVRGRKIDVPAYRQRAFFRLKATCVPRLSKVDASTSCAFDFPRLQKREVERVAARSKSPR